MIIGFEKEIQAQEMAEEEARCMAKMEAERQLNASTKPKRVWTEDEMKHLVQTNDKVLYGALKRLYECQTADEQSMGETRDANGVGFNGADSRILSSMAEFLKKTGFLTPKQRVVVRKKLVKYNKQLVRLANA